MAFAGAALLFQVQPLLGKRLLPWFGGTPSTWTTCMLFFQSALFLGYALADQLIRRCSLRLQLALEACLLLLACAALPLGPWPVDRPTSVERPIAQIFGLLVRHDGLPYLLLATTAPLVQHWFERATRRAPYALYAASNAGSLLGLVGYVLWLEPRLGTAEQARLWSLGFAVFAAALIAVGLDAVLRERGARTDDRGAVEPAGPAPSLGAHACWFALSALPVVMLLAVTNYITVDVAPLPLFWVAPLLLYLASFVLSFGSARFYRRSVFAPLWAVCVAALGVALFAQGSARLWQQLGAFLAALFVACVLCHGELMRARPAPGYGSRFYLVIAGGGAAGGAFVALLAPGLFTGFFELQIATVGTSLLLLIVLRRERGASKAELRFLYLGLGLGAPLIVATAWVEGQDRSYTGHVIERRRDFYGVLRVTDFPDVRVLSHGRIRHGMQFRDPARAQSPTMYFGPDSGVGRALRLHARERPRRIGVLGLGVGTLACYARPGDRLRFYEINPNVVALARTRFSFLERTQAMVEVVQGDGRLSLEREPDQGFDLLVLDAFASDAVPTHLLTAEAFALYLRHLRADGVLLANVSNRHLEVERVVAGAALRANLRLRLLATASDPARGLAPVRWALLARDAIELERLLAGAPRTSARGQPVFWTDERSSLLELLH